jgi:hypothetical protein
LDKSILIKKGEKERMKLKQFREYWEAQKQDVRLVLEEDDLSWFQIEIDNTDDVQVMGYDWVLVTALVKDEEVVKIAYDSHVAYETELLANLRKKLWE